jgi:ornithine cyclodeaminase
MPSPLTNRHATRFLSPQDIASIITRQGLAATLKEMSDCIRQDFLRWNSFDKSARLAAH